MLSNHGTVRKLLLKMEESYRDIVETPFTVDGVPAVDALSEHTGWCATKLGLPSYIPPR